MIPSYALFFWGPVYFSGGSRPSTRDGDGEQRYSPRSPRFSAFFLRYLSPCISDGTEEKNRARLEQLADRLRQLYKRAGQPALRVRRPRRLHFETHQALRELEKSLKTLECHHQIHSRRLRYPRMFIDDPNPVLDNMDQRISRLEEIDVK